MRKLKGHSVYSWSWRSSRGPSTRRSALILFMLIAAVAVVSAFPTIEDSPKQQGSRDAAAKRQAEAKQQVAEKRREIESEQARAYANVERIAPYWLVGNGFNSTMVVTNAQGSPLTVDAEVFASDGRLLATRQLALPENGSIDVSLADIVGSRPQHGHVRLKYRGLPIGVNGAVVVTNREKSLSNSNNFENPSDYSSSRLAGILYTPSASADAEVAITNITGATLTVALSTTREDDETRKNDRSAGSDRRLEIGPHETEVVNLRPLLSQNRRGEASSISLIHSGRPGDILVAGRVTDPNGFSANIRFLDYPQLEASTLFSPILDLETPLKPIALFGNSTSRPVSVTIEAYYTLDQQSEDMVLFTASVPGGGVTHTDLSLYLDQIPAKAANIGLAFSYGSRVSGVISDLLLVDRSGSQVLQVSPKAYGYGAHSHADHSFPFRVGEHLDTLVTVGNPSETEKTEYALVLYYEGRSYTAAVKALEPGEVRHISIKTWRDQQVKGFLDATLPKNLATGQVKVFSRSKGGGEYGHHHGDGSYGNGMSAVLSGSTIVDTLDKLSMTNCYGGPPEYWVSGYVDPNYIEDVPGESESDDVPLDIVGVYTYHEEPVGISDVDVDLEDVAYIYQGSYNLMVRLVSPGYTVASFTTVEVPTPYGWYAMELSQALGVTVQANSCSLTANFSGALTSGNNLSFAPAGYVCGGNTLGVADCSTAWVLKTEISGTVTGSASTWATKQSVTGRRLMILDMDPETDETFNDPDDDPGSTFVQKPSGQTKVFWIDSPGSLKAGGGKTVTSLYQIQNFTSKLEKGSASCQVQWHFKLVVAGGSLHSTYFGLGHISTQ